MAKIKFTSKYLAQLENIFRQAGYMVRYEKGNFKSGYCILKNTKVVVINRYYTLEGKVNCLVEILKTVDWAFENLEEPEKNIYQQIKNTK